MKFARAPAMQRAHFIFAGVYRSLRGGGGGRSHRRKTASKKTYDQPIGKDWAFRLTTKKATFEKLCVIMEAAKENLPGDAAEGGLSLSSCFPHPKRNIY